MYLGVAPPVSTVRQGAIYFHLRFFITCNPPADIPPPTVHLLIKELKEVKDWYLFGVVLGIPVRQLQVIQLSKPLGGVNQWLVDMFDYWLRNNLDPSWKHIVQALEQIDQFVLAAQVKIKYLSPLTPPNAVGKLDTLVCFYF